MTIANTSGHKLTALSIRQAIAALRSKRWPIPVVSQTFGIGRASALNLGSLSHNTYRAAKVELEQAGLSAFIAQYLTVDVIERLERTNEAREAELAAARLERAKQRRAEIVELALAAGYKP